MDTLAGTPWSRAQVIAFRFAFAYLMLFCLPWLIDSVPGAEYVTSVVWYVPLEGVARWAGTHVLGVGAALLSSVSGGPDGLISYCIIFVRLILAIVIAIAWTVVDPRRREHGRLVTWLRVVVRFSLAVIMIGYGSAKIFPNQFPQPTLEHLAQSLGNYSPMGLLWTFMGYSSAYTVFAGVGEIVGAVFLCFRRTTSIGALILVGVLSNVVMVNLAYDVPVKTLSAHLFLMALFLAAPDLKRIFNLIVRRRPTVPPILQSVCATPALHLAVLALRSIVVAYLLYSGFAFERSRYVAEGPSAPKPPLYGIYDLRALTRNGLVIPLLLTDSTLWSRIVFSEYGRVNIRIPTDSVLHFTARVDTARKNILLISGSDTTHSLHLAYARPASEQLVLTGIVHGDSVVAHFAKADAARYLLRSRGFHWVQEQPFYR